jgi:NADPH2:quinone reductase
VLFGVASGPVDSVGTLELAEAGSVFFTRPQLRHYLGSPADLQACAAALFAAIVAREVEISIHATLPLSAAQESHRIIEGRQTLGKLLLRIGGE